MLNIASNTIDKIGNAGILGTPLQAFCFVNGFPMSLDGEKVASHYPYVPPHVSSTMQATSICTHVNGIRVVRKFDLSTCGDDLSIVTNQFCFSD